MDAHFDVRATLGMIQGHIDDHGYPPTVREMASVMGLRSASATLKRLRILKDRGYITWHEGRPRTIQIVRWPDE